MRHITTLLILIFSTSIFAQNNVVKTAGVSYTAGAPTFSPGRTGSQVAIDTVTGYWYEYNGTSWSASGYRVQTISGCSAPAYTPTKFQSLVVVNACTVPELYQWTGAAWVRLNEGQTYTAGTGIDITGGVISATGGGSTDTTYVLISGQSNAWGASAPFQGDTTGNDNVQAWNGASWVRATINQIPFRCAANNPTFPVYSGSNNFGLHFAKYLQSDKGGIVRLVLVPFDGNSISQWIPSGSTNFTAITNAISSAGVEKIDYFLWHQGESDNGQTGAYYNLKFDTLKIQLRAQSWFPANTPIIVGGLLVGGAQSAQAAALAKYDYGTDPFVAYATSAGLTNNGIDNLHFGGSSLVELGLRYYASAKSLPRPSSQQGVNPVTDVWWKRNGQQLYYDSSNVYLPNTSQQFAVGSTPTGDAIAATMSSGDNNITPFQGRNTSASGISGASFLSSAGDLAFFGYTNPSASFIAPDAAMISVYPAKPIVFAVNLSEAGRFTPTKQFLIGKASSSYKFDVAGTGRFDSDVSFGGSGFFANSIGIGVTSTSRKLDVVYSSGSLGYRAVQFRNTDASAGAFLSVSNHDDTNGLLFGYINSGAPFLGGDCGFFNTYNAKPLVFATNSIERIRITSAGRIGINNTAPNASAAVDITSTTAGFLPPRMTTAQRDAISSPATGLSLYCTDCTATDASTGVMQVYNGTTWKNAW